jgi:hypothetical protein
MILVAVQIEPPLAGSPETFTFVALGLGVAVGVPVGRLEVVIATAWATDPGSS